MNPIYAYHVVTERKMQKNQILTFDEQHHSGVYERVYEKQNEVEQIYAHSAQYEAATLPHHTLVAIRELALEEVRRNHYPAYPSRLSCLYVSETLEEARKWAELFISLGRATYGIVKVNITGSYFMGDANNCFDATTNKEYNLKLAEHYWKNLPNLAQKPPIKEILVDGIIEVVEIIEEIQTEKRIC